MTTAQDVLQWIYIVWVWAGPDRTEARQIHGGGEYIMHYLTKTTTCAVQRYRMD